MAHHNTIKSNSYNNLVQRLNIFPQGAPPSELLFKILKVLFSEREAKLVSELPIKPFTDKKMAAIWKLNPNDARIILNDLADRGILLDYENDGSTTYVLPPPMAQCLVLFLNFLPPNSCWRAGSLSQGIY